MPTEENKPSEQTSVGEPDQTVVTPPSEEEKKPSGTSPQTTTETQEEKEITGTEDGPEESKRTETTPEGEEGE